MRRLATCFAVGLSLLYYAAKASAAPNLEVSTTLGGADSSEYLVRVENPDAADAWGDIELRRPGEPDGHALSRAPYQVPAGSTRYFRIPGEKGLRLDAFAVPAPGAFGSDGKTVRAQERYSGEGALVIFDIPPRDEARLHELRVHTSGLTAVVTHATFDESTHTPVLTRRAAVYDGVALVVVPSSRFLSLPDAEREALTTWVRAGGSIAISVTDESDLPRLAELVGSGVKGVKEDTAIKGSWTGGRLRPGTFGAQADLGLGHVHLLPLNVWSNDANGDVTIQGKLAELAEQHRTSYHLFGEPWMDMPMASLDPNQGYRSVLPLAGILLVLQALGTAFAFRRLAMKRGMGSAYRFVAASSAVTFGAVIGLGIYAKGGFGARARELTFADAASGESVAWVERSRTYFSSDARTIEVTAHDPLNVLSSRARDSHAVLHADDTSLVLGNVAVRPWQTTAVSERGTTTLGEGVRIESDRGNITVHNASGSTLHNVIVSIPYGGCLDLGDIPNREEKSGGIPLSCSDLGPAWKTYQTSYVTNLERYLNSPGHLTLLGQIEEAPTTIDGFRLEKRTTLVRITGGAS